MVNEVTSGERWEGTGGCYELLLLSSDVLVLDAKTGPLIFYIYRLALRNLRDPEILSSVWSGESTLLV